MKQVLTTIAAFAGLVCGSTGRLASPAAARKANISVCSIEGRTFAVGLPNPDNSCQACAAQDPTEWSAAFEGMACAPDHTCHRGHCWRVLSPADQYRRMAVTFFDGMLRPHDNSR